MPSRPPGAPRIRPRRLARLARLPQRKVVRGTFHRPVGQRAFAIGVEDLVVLVCAFSFRSSAWTAWGCFSAVALVKTRDLVSSLFTLSTASTKDSGVLSEGRDGRVFRM